MCEKHEIDVPALEEVIRKNSLPEEVEVSEDMALMLSTAEEKINELPVELQGEFQKLVNTFQVLTRIQSYGGATTKNIQALMNKIPVEDAGLSPIRPDYLKINLPDHSELLAPDEYTKIIIVDDSPAEILKSHLVASGIANTEFMWILDNREGWGEITDEDEKNEALGTVSTAIAEAKPHIVLMDQGLKRINGSDVVRHFISNVSNEVLFVANTGGSEDELLDAGCVGTKNYNKGGNKEALYTALRMR